LVLETIANWDKGLKTKPAGQGPKTVLQGEAGGKLDEHWYRFKAMNAAGVEVEVRGRCQSACTLITGVIPKSRLCFGENSLLAIHWAREGSWNGPLSYKSTQWVLDHYPDDIREWINSLGGIDKMPQVGWWVLPASTLWAMGYRRCAPWPPQQADGAK
jgi:hypothetical protein